MLLFTTPKTQKYTQTSVSVTSFQLFLSFCSSVIAPIPIPIPQFLMTALAQNPKRLAFNSPCPLVQLLEFESSVVSSRPQILCGAIPMYALPVLSAGSTSARPREGCWATLVVLDLVLSSLSLARFLFRIFHVNSRARSRSTWTRTILARGGASYPRWRGIKSESRGSLEKAICIG